MGVGQASLPSTCTLRVHVRTHTSPGLATESAEIISPGTAATDTRHGHQTAVPTRSLPSLPHTWHVRSLSLRRELPGRATSGERWMGTPSAEYHPKGAGPRCTGVRRPTGPAGPEPRKEGPPLGIQEAQGSMSAQQCPQDEALAWPICSVTFSTHSLARQTRQTHSAPAFRAPWPCPAHAQPDNELCGSAAGGWTRLDGEGRRPRLPAVGKARQVQGPSRPRTTKEVGYRGSDRALSLSLLRAGVLGSRTWIHQVYTDPRVYTPNPKCSHPLLRPPAPAAGLVAVPGGMVTEVCL